MRDEADHRQQNDNQPNAEIIVDFSKKREAR
jgi:hypothetical protein